MSETIERRAVAAAGEVASAHGLNVDRPVVIYSGSNVLVHLRPAPVVARVMSGTIAIHDDPRRWLQREVSVLQFLAGSGLAVTPSRLIAPGPYCHDGLWMTFTELVADVQSRPAADQAVSVDEARAIGRMLRELHDALAAYDGELAGGVELAADIRRLLDQVDPVDEREQATVATLGERLESLRGCVFECDRPVQALHGDVSLSNLLRVPGRAVWNDFEDTFRGPVHWDVASIVSDLRARHSEPRAVRELLDAHGWSDEAELTPFLTAQDVYGIVWQMYDRQRRRA